MAQNTLRASVELDDGGVTKKLNGISKAFDKIGGKGSGASFFGNVGAKAVAKGFDLIGASIGGMTDFLRDAFDAAVEDQQSQDLLGAALKANIPNWDGNTDSLNAYIDAQLQHGFADDDVRASLGQLVGITHDAQKATELNTIAQDLARAKGIDLATATDIVTKAAQGNGKALKALGIDTTGAKDATSLLNDIMKNTKGSMDAYDNTMAGKVNVSQLKFNEAMEKIGYTIMPVVSDLMTQFADEWLPALGRGWDKVTRAIKGFVDQIARGIEKVKQLAHWLDNIIPKINGISAGPTLPGLPLPHFAQGGVVPGGLNEPQLIVAHGGETIIPVGGASAGGGGGTGVTIQGVSARDLDRIIDDRMFVLIRRAAPGTS